MSNLENVETDQEEPERRHESQADVITVQNPSISIRIKVWFKEAKEQFNWDDFFFCLIFGLAPTAWDMYTDLELASHLLENENAHAAGLCYVFICLPGINLVKEQVGIGYDIQQDHLGMNIAPMFNHSF